MSGTERTSVTCDGVIYERSRRGVWYQACGLEMPERDWRWLDRIAELENALRLAFTAIERSSPRPGDERWVRDTVVPEITKALS